MRRTQRWSVRHHSGHHARRRPMRGGEAQYNPLCRRLHGAGRQPSVDASEEAGGRGSDAGVDGGDGESDGSSSGSDVGVDVETEARRARVARLRYQREMRDDIARQLRTLEEIRRERETRAALDGEMAALRRKLGEERAASCALGVSFVCDRAHDPR